MTGVLLDTCAFAWMLLGKDHIGSSAARSAIDDARDPLFVSAATFYEITRKVRLGKWDEMAPDVQDLISHPYLEPSQILDLNGPTCIEAGAMVWSHRDPFDRRDVTQKRSADHFDGIVIRIW